jgi:hypothetical protein
MGKPIILSKMCLVIILTVSCASPPKQIYITRADNSRFNKVALNISTGELTVRDETEKNFPWWSIFIPPIFWAAEYGSRSAADNQMAIEVRMEEIKSYCEKVLRDSFLADVIMGDVRSKTTSGESGSGVDALGGGGGRSFGVRA